MFSKKSFMRIGSCASLALSLSSFSALADNITQTTTGADVQSQRQAQAQAMQKIKTTTQNWGHSAHSGIDNHFEDFMKRHPEFAKYKEKLRNSAHKLANTTPKQDVHSAYDNTKAKIENRVESHYNNDNGKVGNSQQNARSFEAAREKMKSELANYF